MSEQVKDNVVQQDLSTTTSTTDIESDNYLMERIPTKLELFHKLVESHLILCKAFEKMEVSENFTE